MRMPRRGVTLVARYPAGILLARVGAPLLGLAVWAAPPAAVARPACAPQAAVAVAGATSQILAGRSLESAAERYVEHLYGSGVLARAVNHVPDEQVPCGAVQLAPHVNAASGLGSDRVIVPVAVHVNGRLYTTVAVMVGVSRSRTAAASTAEGRSNESRPVLSAPAVMLDAPVATFQPPALPDVQAGQALTLHVRGNGLEVQVPCVAVQSGRVGDLIRVEVDNPRRLLNVRLVNDREVELQP